MIEDKEPLMIHKYFFESITTKLERTIEKLWILCIILIILFVGSNAAWIYYENQFTDTEVMQEVDTGNGNATITGVGDIFYGEGETNSENAEP